jgi:hypothetical protein
MGWHARVAACFGCSEEPLSLRHLMRLVNCGLIHFPHLFLGRFLIFLSKGWRSLLFIFCSHFYIFNLVFIRKLELRVKLRRQVLALVERCSTCMASWFLLEE